MSAANSLDDIYAGRSEAISTLVGTGLRTAGIYGFGAPYELMIAHDLLPIMIAPPPDRPTPVADHYLYPTCEPRLRTAFDALVGGDLTKLDLALIVSQFESDALLYHSCKEVLRRGEGGALPPLHLHVALGDESVAVADYSVGQVRRLASRLSAATGVDTSPSRLANAVRVTNSVRLVRQRLLDVRWQGRIDGLTAFRAAAAGYFMAPEDYVETLDIYLTRLSNMGVRRPRVLLVSSVSLFFDNLHQAIESAGVHILAEDDAWGARAHGPQLSIDGDPLVSLANYYRSNTPNRAIFPHEARYAWLYEHAVRPEVDAVIFYMPRSDEQLGWDYPRLRDFLDAVGKRHIWLADDVFAPGGPERIREKAHDFLVAAEAAA